MKWNLEELKILLKSNPKVRDWIIYQEHSRRRERYFISGGAVDQDRDTDSQNIVLKVLVHKGTPGRIGETSKKLFLTLPLRAQVEAAVESAMHTDLEEWKLPTAPTEKTPDLKSADPNISEDIEKVVDELSEQIQGCIQVPRETIFNSAELFISSHDYETHYSNGVTHRMRQSRIYSEAAFSYEKRDSRGVKQSDEFVTREWSVSLKDLEVKRLFDETSDRARHTLEVQKPKTGRYFVLVSAEVLSVLFSDYLFQLSAGNEYHRLPFKKPGDFLVNGARGDLITLTLDPFLEFGAATNAFSDQGVLMKKLDLVQNNKVINTATDKQYADYLKRNPNTSSGNMVVPPGTLPYTSLIQAEDQVLEILQFSGLFSDPNSGTFSSEIRLAKLYDNKTGETSYLKGGSLSGSIYENFINVRFSKELSKNAEFSSFFHQSGHGRGYFGPKYALLSDVSVVG